MDRNSPPTPCRPLDELEAEITELAGHLNAAQHRWLTLIAEFDRRKGWSDGACLSCAHWLNIWTPPALQARLCVWIQDRTATIYPASDASVDAGPDDFRSQVPRNFIGV
jgi:hypothetical protein